MHETLITDLILDKITNRLSRIPTLTSLGLHLYLVNVSVLPTAIPLPNIQKLELDGCFPDSTLWTFLRLFPGLKTLTLFQYGYLPVNIIIPIISDLSGQLEELSLGFNHPSSACELICGLVSISMPALVSLGLEVDEFPAIMHFMDAKMPALRTLSFDVYETLAPLDEIETLGLAGKFPALRSFKIVSRFPSGPPEGPTEAQLKLLEEGIPSTVSRLALKGIDFTHEIKTGMDT